MTPEERGRRLVGDMPWITDGLTGMQIDDLRKQIATSIEVADHDAHARGRAEMREECAKLVQEGMDSPESAQAILNLCAAAIRALK